jgi:hypothetical protein
MSLKEQISQLQDQVNALSKNRSFSVTDKDDIADAFFFDTDVFESHQSPKWRSLSMSNVSDNDMFESRSVGSFGSHQEIPSPSSETMESDMLGVTLPSLNSLPIGSQLNALRQLRQPSATDDSGDPAQSGLATVNLQEPQILWELVDVFFQEFESYFPCLNQAVIYERLSMVLSLHEYKHGNLSIVIGPEHCQIVAILLNMLAYAESLTCRVESCKPRPVPQSYLQGLRLMQYFNKLHDGSLETVIYHTTSSAFLLEMSMHHMALQSITQGFQTALKIGLNNPNLWSNDGSDIASRQGLWWTLYFLDKRITQKCGITYFLREDESSLSDLEKLKNHMGSNKYELLHSLISFSRLWAHIWDGFFSPQAPMVDNWEESQMMDTRIVLAYRQIPASLHWKSSMLAEYMCVEGETHIRQRLIVFLVRSLSPITMFHSTIIMLTYLQRFQSLRLSIRHKPFTSIEHDIERRKASVSICEVIMEAIRGYMTMTTSLKPSGYILTTSLVEVLYHILPEECDQKPIVPVEHLREMVCTTSQLLQTLSDSVATASKVYQYLRDLLPTYDKVGPFDEFTASSPSRKRANQKTPLDCSADLDTLSETFWRTIVDRPGQERSPAAIHSDPSNQNLLPFSLAISENYATDCLPKEMEDLQCQLLMGMDLESMAFKAPHALSMDYSATQFQGDLL